MKDNYPLGAVGDANAPFNLPDAPLLDEITVQLRMSENTPACDMAREVIEQLEAYVQGKDHDLNISFETVEAL